jgi:hypothetical protein
MKYKRDHFILAVETYHQFGVRIKHSRAEMYTLQQLHAR